jgi:hypothetical protein
MIFALPRDFGVTGFIFGVFTQGGAHYARLPWANICHPLRGFQFAAAPTVGNFVRWFEMKTAKEFSEFPLS